MSDIVESPVEKSRRMQPLLVEIREFIMRPREHATPTEVAEMLVIEAVLALGADRVVAIADRIKGRLGGIAAASPYTLR
ncbi:hypothetical protein UFOVP1382_41 [uncultured Caudovirales phage]|uniref:Uncharacterized protein n=1 Tax=uncultured Caudovirales phage TaxID=2100421 RepID=A0A6J5S588_9CAUD|nr:hypothetical protein UFOVP1382_41 [uncultured Caudovirales phage]